MTAGQDQRWRQAVRTGLQRYFEARSRPRTILTVILVLTGTFAFAISVGLLHLGLWRMWLRYPLVVLLAYVFFLTLLRGWVEWEKSGLDPEALNTEDALQLSGNDPSRSERGYWSWLDWLDFSGFDAEPGCIPLALLIAALLGLIALFVYAMFFASGLIAEVFLDAFIVAVLSRKLRIAAQEHWLGTAVRKTWLPALLTALLLSVAGWSLGAIAPGSHSIGPALHRLLDRPPQNRPNP